MKSSIRKMVFGLCLCAAVATTPTEAAEPNDSLQRMVTCQDSWLDFQNDERRVDRFIELLDTHFRRDNKLKALVPRAGATLMGYPIVDVTPETVGIGQGFGVTVKAPLDEVRKSYEAALGRKMTECKREDEGMTICSVEIARQKTATLITPTKRPEVGTLMGCYYKYER